MDGAGSALVFMRAGGRRENIHFVPAGMLERFVKEAPVMNEDRFIIFADIGFNMSHYASRLDKRGNCALLDHHKTSLHMADRPWAQIRMDACGTQLMREYLGHLLVGPDILTCETLSAVIDDHDRWLCQIPASSELAMFMVFVGQQDFIDRYSNGRQVTGFDDLFTDFERDLLGVLKRRRDESISHALKHVIKRDLIVGNQCFRIAYVVSDDPNTSILLNTVLEEMPDVQVAAQLMLGSAKVSLRSRGDFDVSELAKRFGGGGHAAASGHLILQSVIEEFISEVHRG